MARTTDWPDRLGHLATEPVGEGLTLHVAERFGARRRGLAKMAPMPEDHALHILRCNSVHTFGMCFALDLVWLAKDGTVLRVDEDVAPRRLRMCTHAKTVIEARAGAGTRFAQAWSARGV
ncbi:MAG: DUF192 domain-containing protein [Solirubrobacteraceae bacterium]